MTTFKLGKSRITNRIVPIMEAQNGLNCHCVCPECGNPFVAVQGKTNEWHYRHYYETTCKGGQETALHFLTKEIIASNNQITLPTYGTVSYENPAIEKPFGKFKPDVTFTTSGQNIFVEIAVTHQVDSAKEEFYKSGEHKSFEIDLKNYVFISREELTKVLLGSAARKRIIFWGNKEIAEKSGDNSLIRGLAILVLVVLAFRWLTKMLR